MSIRLLLAALEGRPFATVDRYVVMHDAQRMVRRLLQRQWIIDQPGQYARAAFGGFGGFVEQYAIAVTVKYPRQSRGLDIVSASKA